MVTRITGRHHGRLARIAAKYGLGSPARGLTSAQFEKRLDTLYGKGEYRLAGPFNGINFKSRFRHSCGIEFEASGARMSRKAASCPCFHKRIRIMTPEIHQVRMVTRPDFECLDFDVIRGGHGQATYRHLTCGFEFQESPNGFLKWKKGICPECHKHGSYRLTPEEVVARFENRFHGEYVPLQTNQGIKKTSKVRHTSCGTVYECSYTNLLYGKGSQHCPNCRWDLKEVLIRGKSFKCQGYEPYAVQELCQRHRVVHVHTWASRRVPYFRYSYGDQEHRYFPDLLVSSENLIVEVKSPATLGIVDGAPFGDGSLPRVQAKAKAVLDAGYQFDLFLYTSGGRRIELPRNWMLMNKVQLQSAVN